MYQMEFGDWILGMLCGGVAIATIIVIVIVASKKNKKALDEAFSNVSEEQINQMRNAGYKPDPENSKKILGFGLVTNIVEESGKVKLTIVFRNGFVGEDVINKVAIDKATFQSKNIKVGDFVQTIHKKDKDIGMSGVKGIL